MSRTAILAGWISRLRRGGGLRDRAPALPRRLLLLALAVVVLLPVAGYDFANRVQYHAGSKPGSWTPGPTAFAAFLRAYPHVFTPARFRRRFDLPADLGGRGQTIAIVEVENGFSRTAMARFDSGFHLPAASVRVVDASGRPLPRPRATNETMLDVEWAHAIAPQAALAVVVWDVTGLSTGARLLASALAKVHPTVVSVSAIAAGPWALAAARAGFDLGWRPLTAYPTFVSSGDGGNGLGLPALLPGVAAVGGTAWENGRSLVWPSSGGGYADWVSPRPSWQTGNRSRWRGVPDVAWLAGWPGLATYVRGWVALEGTSAAAPEWAALWALGDQLRAARGRPPIRGPAPAALFAVAREDAAAFRQPPRVPAGPWNPVTGLGVPAPRRFLATFAALPGDCCRVPSPPVGSLPLMALLFLAGCGLYAGGAGLPRRRSWPLWAGGLAAVAFAAYGLSDGRPAFVAGAVAAFAAALAATALL